VSIKIVLADDHQILREGLRNLFAKEGDINVVGEAEDGRAAVKIAEESLPDIMIMDVSMPGLNGIEASRQILSVSPKTKIIALSMYPDRQLVTSMLSAGAAGYLLKGCGFNELLNAIKSVMAGSIYISRELVDTVMRDYVERIQRSDLSIYSTLTPREIEVLQLVAEGKSVKTIAQDLCISVRTVETHRHRIMDKLNIGSIADLVKYAIREGIIQL
jgi:DNA-binding NarL/FixJ family response regulator